MWQLQGPDSTTKTTQKLYVSKCNTKAKEYVEQKSDRLASGCLWAVNLSTEQTVKSKRFTGLHTIPTCQDLLDPFGARLQNLLDGLHMMLFPPHTICQASGKATIEICFSEHVAHALSSASGGTHWTQAPKIAFRCLRCQVWKGPNCLFVSNSRNLAFLASFSSQWSRLLGQPTVAPNHPGAPYGLQKFAMSESGIAAQQLCSDKCPGIRSKTWK